MNSEASIAIARVVNCEEYNYVGFLQDLKVVFTNPLYLYSSLIFTMK